MSEISEFSQSSANMNKAPKTKQEYSRNVKKLKLKLAYIEQQIQSVQKKMKIFSDTSNDKMIALKISKFCKQRRIAPEMLFRFADRKRKNNISKAAFKQTLVGLGIRLTQHELTRLQYLLDEDISGEISWAQYNSYLIAFNIKGQFSQTEQFLKNFLNKVDLLDVINDKQKQDPANKKKQLLNYEQFLKFCHRKLPHLKDKQIAAIFNILQRDGLIDLDQFIQYIKKRDEQRRRIQQKNKKKGNKPDVEITDQSKTLKGIIKLILKHRPKDSKALFHTIQFKKLEQLLGKEKGQLLKLFKYIDKQKRGSFTFKQLIQFYIQRQKEGDLLFAFELMGRKMYIDKQIPEDVLHRYNGGANYKKISLEDFKKFMFQQFNVLEGDAQSLFRALQKKQNFVPIRAIIDAMKLQQGQKKMVYIKPTSWKTFPKDYWKKNCNTILFNPFVALRFCLQVMEELKKVDQTYWDDFEFGPTFQDPFGTLSINLDNLSETQVKWMTVQSLGMNEFYMDTNNEQYDSSMAAPDDTFSKVLCQMNRESKSLLWNKQKLDYNTKKVEQWHLKQLFEGTYPQIFHSFSSCGIYVFRFFVHEKWAYVIVDNKIPCNSNNEPIFTFEKTKKYSWISLIQKAYAKIKGSYGNIYNSSLEQYVYQLNRKLPLTLHLSNLTTPEIKDKAWQDMIKFQKQSNTAYSLVSNASAHQLKQNNVQTGIKKNYLYSIISLLEIKDDACENYHKSHRLVAFKNNSGVLKNEVTWNPSWNSGEDTNKYDKFQKQIESSLVNNKVNSSVLKEKYTVVVNYKLFRSIFDYLLKVQAVSFEDTIVLRKVSEFQEKFVCKYELNSKKKNNQSVKLIVTLNRISSPNDTCIELTLKDEKMIQITKKSTNCHFAAFQFDIGSQMQYLEIKVANWHPGQDHVYSLTFYFLSPLFHLKELDRQLLFKTVSPYEQQYYLDIEEADQKQKKHIYRNYYKGAERGNGCCG